MRLTVLMVLVAARSRKTAHRAVPPLRRRAPHGPAALAVARQGARGRGHAARRPAEAREEPVRGLAGGAAVARAAARATTRERPARTLLIAAEDPVDTIVKSRLIAAAADEAMVGTLVTSPFKTIKTIKTA